MEVGSLFFLLAIIVVVLIIITQPFYRLSTTQGSTAPLPLKVDEEDAEYQGIIRNIRELTSDYELGKMSDEDFALQRGLLEEQAFRWMKQKESVQESSNPARSAEQEIEEMIYSRRKNRVEQTSGFCPRCGKPVQKSDLFCPSCGEPTRMYG